MVLEETLVAEAATFQPPAIGARVAGDRRVDRWRGSIHHVGYPLPTRNPLPSSQFNFLIYSRHLSLTSTTTISLLPLVTRVSSTLVVARRLSRRPHRSLQLPILHLPL